MIPFRDFKKLRVTSTTNGFFPITWSYVKKNRPTLKTLQTSNVLNAMWRWTAMALVELLQFCLKLASLTIDLEPGLELQPSGEKQSVWVSDQISCIGYLCNKKL